MKKLLILFCAVFIFNISLYAQSVMLPNGDEYYIVPQEYGDEIWRIDSYGNKKMVLNKIDNPGNELNVAEYIDIVDDRLVLSGDIIYFQIKAYEVSNAFMRFDIQSGNVEYITDVLDFKLITNGKYKGNMIVAKHMYPEIAGGAVDMWWIYDVEKRDIIKLFSSEYYFEIYEEYEEIWEDEYGLV